MLVCSLSNLCNKQTWRRRRYVATLGKRLHLGYSFCLKAEIGDRCLLYDRWMRAHWSTCILLHQQRHW